MSKTKEPRSYTIVSLVVAAVVISTSELVFGHLMPADPELRLAVYIALALVAGALGHFVGRLAARASAGIRYIQRVRVRSDRVHGLAPWPDEPVGVIVSGRGRLVQTRSGPRRMFWVRFDVPQRRRH